MAKFTFYWLCFCLLAAPSGHAKELLLVAGLEKPPYVMPTNDSGFELEIMRDVLAGLGHDISVVYVPYGRTYEIMQQINADIGLTLISRSGAKTHELTRPYVVYQNVAISLKSKNIHLKHIIDLQKHSLVAFQNAHKILGEDFSQAAKISPLYFELPDQKRQVELLLNGKVDMIVMDINIFKYLAKAIVGTSQINNVDVHSVFPSTYYRAAIRADALRKEFNQAFSKYIKSDKYTQLRQKYDMPFLLKDKL